MKAGGTSPTTDSYVYPENIELKLNSTWEKGKVWKIFIAAAENVGQRG
jgi:hypothetical protein